MTTLSAPVGGAAVPFSTLLSGSDKQTADNHVVAPWKICKGQIFIPVGKTTFLFRQRVHQSSITMNQHGDPAILTQLMSINCIPARRANRFEA